MVGPRQPADWHRWVNVLFIVLIAVGLFGLGLSRHWYLLYHAIVEFFSVAISIVIFSIGWNTRGFTAQRYLLILAVGYLFVGIIDFMHTLAYQGMGIFPVTGANLATQYWVLARYIEGLTILLAALTLSWRMRVSAHALFLAYLLPVTVLAVLIFPLQLFPEAYRPIGGLTAFKIYSEYVIVALLLLSGWLFWRNRHALNQRILLYLLLAVASKIVSEICFTLYTVDVFGVMNATGHIFKLLSTLAFYLALVQGSLQRPFNSIFYDLVQSRQQTQEELAERLKVEAEREQLLQENQRRIAEMHTVLNAIPDGLVIYSPDQRIVQMNTTAETLLGLTQDEWTLTIAERWARRKVTFADGSPITPENNPVVRALHGEKIQGAMLQGCIADRTVWLNLSAAPFHRANDKIAGVVSIFTDVTVLHELQQQRDIYIHTISHDLRAPLTVIRGHAQLLLEMIEDAAQRESLLAISRGTQHMNAMIQDLVDAARAEGGRIHLERTAINLASILDELIRQNRLSMEVERIEVALSANLPPVLADANRLERILINLLSNALKYSSPGSPVRLAARQTDETVILSVTDQGVGIQPDELPKLFTPFFRTKASKKMEGIGLGLYITRMMVEAHGGRIWAESTPGKGSTFSFSLPRA